MKIKVYGEEAKKMKEGMLFKVTMDSVEGRDIAILERF